LGQNVAMTVRHDGVGRTAGTDLPATDDDRNLDLSATQVFECLLELTALAGPRRVGEDGLVDGGGNLGRRVHRRNLTDESPALEPQTVWDIGAASPGHVSATLR